MNLWKCQIKNNPPNLNCFAPPNLGLKIATIRANKNGLLKSNSYTSDTFVSCLAHTVGSIVIRRDENNVG